MEFRKLGRTDLTVSRIGFGCWAIGGHGYGNVDDRESIRAIRRAFDSGINFFDTADVYGLGHSEEVLGKALDSEKDKVVIATKFGVDWDTNGKTFKDCSPKRVRGALEASLRRLKIDCITLYQIHWHDGSTLLHELMDVLERCIQEGKIRYVGCTNFSIGLIEDLNARQYRLESLQLPYNVLERTSEKTIRYCSEMLDMGIIVYSVLARGLFSGKYDMETIFGENDTRSRDNMFSTYALNKNLKLVNALKDIGTRYGKTSSQVAIRWALERHDIATAIIGVKNPCQIEENIGAIGWNMDCSDYDFITLLADNVRLSAL